MGRTVRGQRYKGGVRCGARDAVRGRAATQGLALLMQSFAIARRRMMRLFSSSSLGGRTSTAR